MVVRLPLNVAVASCFLLLSTAVQAATLENIQGVVLVDRGSGFSIVTSTTQLTPGDSVIANPGASAQLVYPDGCRIPVYPGNVVAAAAKSPCTHSAAPADGPPPNPDAPAPPVEEASEEGGGGGLGSTAIIVGVTAAGVGVGAAVLLTGDDSEKPASP